MGAVLVAFLAIFFDTLSDYTCDWWLESCRQTSRGLLMLYSGIMIFLVYTIWKLYQERGRIAAVSGTVAMGQASIRMGLEYGKNLKETVLVQATELRTSNDSK